MKTRILLVDDHPMLRSGLRQELAKQPQLEVVGEAGDGATAVKLASELTPDLVVLDIQLPDKDGITVLQEIRNVLSRVKVIIFSANINRLLVDQALQFGASAYVIKSSEVAELIKAIEMAVGGRLYVSVEISAAILEDYQRSLAGATTPNEPAFSEREKQLLRFIANGDRSKVIAERLNISISSVDTYRTRLRKKLGCQSTAELIRYAISHNLIPG